GGTTSTYYTINSMTTLIILRSTLSLHDALPISSARLTFLSEMVGWQGRCEDAGLNGGRRGCTVPTADRGRGEPCSPDAPRLGRRDRKRTRLNFSHLVITYAVLGLLKKTVLSSVP